MALTKADKEFIELSLKPIVQRLDTFKEINDKQDERLEKLEETSIERGNIITQMDAWHETGREATCPQNDRIKEVENVQNKNKITKKFIIKVGAFLAGSVAFMWGLVQLITFFAG